MISTPLTIASYILCWGKDGAAKINVPERVPEQVLDSDTDKETCFLNNS